MKWVIKTLLALTIWAFMTGFFVNLFTLNLLGALFFLIGWNVFARILRGITDGEREEHEAKWYYQIYSEGK